LLGSSFLDIWDVLCPPNTKPGCKSLAWRPNLNHYLLVWVASLARTPILTLNFDTFLEKAADDLKINLHKYVPGVKKLQRVIEWEPDAHTVSLWKIHGCVETRDDNGKSSLHNTMSQVARPNLQVLGVLSDWLRKSTVCIVGYSGRDADFFPHLARMIRSSHSKVVWIDPKFAEQKLPSIGRPSLQDRCRLLEANPTSQNLVPFLDEGMVPGILAHLVASNNGRSIRAVSDLWRSRDVDPIREDCVDKRNQLVSQHEQRLSNPSVPITVRRAILTASLLHSGNTRQGYSYCKAHIEEFRSNLSREMLSKVLLDFGRLCDWNSKYEEYQTSAREALSQVKHFAVQCNEGRYQKLFVRAGGLCLLTRAKHMLMGPFMDWPDRKLTYRMSFCSKVISLLMHLWTTIRVRRLLLDFRRNGPMGRVFNFFRSVVPTKLDLPGASSSAQEVISWQYYLDHWQVFGNLLLKALGRLSVSFRSRFLDNLEREVQLAGAAYSQADVYLWRFRYGLAGDAVLAQHMWGLVANSVGLALVLRDEGRTLLNQGSSAILLEKAAEKFDEAYKLAERCGSHLTALKALIGMYHANKPLNKAAWLHHVEGLEGKKHRVFFADATRYLDSAGAFKIRRGRACLN
jgi:translation initiation factor 2 beta subunit (eIF-2beta)/eIF-5